MRSLQIESRQTFNETDTAPIKLLKIFLKYTTLDSQSVYLKEKLKKLYQHTNERKSYLYNEIIRIITNIIYNLNN